MNYSTIALHTSEISESMKDELDNIVDAAWKGSTFEGELAIIGSVVFVCFMDGKPVGYLSVKEYDNNSTNPIKAFIDFVIYDFAIDPTAQAKYAAVALLSHFRKYVQNIGYDRIFVNSRNVIWGDFPRILNKFPNFDILSKTIAENDEVFTNVIFNLSGDRYLSVVNTRKDLLLEFFYLLQNIALDFTQEEIFLIDSIVQDYIGSEERLSYLLLYAKKIEGMDELVRFDILDQYI